MDEKLYGGKCHICADLIHYGHEGLTREPVEWLPMKGLECVDCLFCQERALSRLFMADERFFIFDNDVREAKRAFARGEDHPILEELRKRP